MSIREFLDLYDVCSEASEFASMFSTLHGAWNACDRVDWLVWTHEYVVPADRGSLRLYGCWCIRQTPLADGRKVWDLLSTESRTAVEVTERFAVGAATSEEHSAAEEAAISAHIDAVYSFPWAVEGAAEAVRAIANHSAGAGVLYSALAAARYGGARLEVSRYGGSRLASFRVAQTFQLAEFRQRFGNPFKKQKTQKQ